LRRFTIRMVLYMEPPLLKLPTGSFDNSDYATFFGCACAKRRPHIGSARQSVDNVRFPASQ
jgi:hypothetical protein